MGLLVFIKQLVEISYYSYCVNDCVRTNVRLVRRHNSIAYGITTIVGYVMHLFIGVLATIMFTIMVVGNHPDGKPTNMNDIPNLTVTGDNNIVTIKSLPKNFKYTEIDGQRLKPNMDQKFKYEVNQDFGTGYLISEDGGKFKLSDEDRDYLKERGVR